MFKKVIHVLWSYSLQDYWKWLWSKTQVDEKVIAELKKLKLELRQLSKLLKEKNNEKHMHICAMDY